MGSSVVKPRVLHNYRDKIDWSRAKYIGRGSFFGNPFPITEDADRDTVCDQYIQLKENDKEFIAHVKGELRGFDLVCFCAPKRCHGDWLLKIANEDNIWTDTE